MIQNYRREQNKNDKQKTHRSSSEVIITKLAFEFLCRVHQFLVIFGWGTFIQDRKQRLLL